LAERVGDRTAHLIENSITMSLMSHLTTQVKLALTRLHQLHSLCVLVIEIKHERR
jgi:hypothetical protein